MQLENITALLKCDSKTKKQNFFEQSKLTLNIFLSWSVCQVSYELGSVLEVSLEYFFSSQL